MIHYDHNTGRHRNIQLQKPRRYRRYIDQYHAEKRAQKIKDRLALILAAVIIDAGIFTAYLLTV